MKTKNRADRSGSIAAAAPAAAPAAPSTSGLHLRTVHPLVGNSTVHLHMLSTPRLAIAVRSITALCPLHPQTIWSALLLHKCILFGFPLPPTRLRHHHAGAQLKKGPSRGPPRMECEQGGRKWVIENHTGAHDIVLEDTNPKQGVYIFGCQQSTIQTVQASTTSEDFIASLKMHSGALQTTLLLCIMPALTSICQPFCHAITAYSRRHSAHCRMQIRGKVNAISMDQCKKTGLVFEDVVSSCELVNSSGVQAQVTGNVPTFSIDKCDGVQVGLVCCVCFIIVCASHASALTAHELRKPIIANILLLASSDKCRNSASHQIFISQAAAGAEIFTAKASEVNISLLRADGEDPSEHALPEQFVSRFVGGRLVTEAVSHGGG
ncbi:hypothetical protein MMC07_006567 [Pseudocyphellaria aurata]|nr:hypothetical protein [Pseudocyphellaria aurata]